MPRPSPPTLTWSAVALARAIRTQQTTAQAVVEAHIDRVKQVNPIINAVVHARFTQALEEAREADAQVAQAVADKTVGELPPLLGVPCTIKECFGLEGMPQTSGLVSRRGVFAERDATAVRRLRDAGAIPLGVTNISELCMWMESHNRVYGRTRNPYDPSRIVGGSSGGEGAIVASGASPFGLGSDIGGSIRMPAFFNGVFGHKPTGGMVPSTGQWPIPPDSEPLRCLGTGPLARCAEDLMPLLRLMAGPDGEDASTQPWSLGDPNAVSVEGMTVISVEGNGFRPVARDLLQAQRRVARMLAQRGARVVHMQFEPLKQSLQMWAAMMNDAQGPKFRVLLGGGTPARLRRNFARYLVRRSEHTLPALVLAALEEMPFLVLKEKEAKAMKQLARELEESILERLGDHGVMLYPSYTRPAPRHRAPLLTPMDWVYTAVFNVLRFPVTQVPLGLNAQGLPLGIQVVGAHGQDHRTIHVAHVLEKHYGGWVPPWTVKGGVDG